MKITQFVVTCGFALGACQAVADTSDTSNATSVKLADLEAEGLVIVDRAWGKPAGVSESGGVMIAAIPVKAIFMGPPPSVDGEIERQWTCPAVDGEAHFNWNCRKYDLAMDAPSNTDQ